MRLSRRIGTKMFTHALFLTPSLLYFHNPWHLGRYNISNSWKGTRIDIHPKKYITKGILGS